MTLMSDKKQPCVVVCVTPQESCARLIEAGADIAKQSGVSLVVLSVFRESCGLNANEGGVLENLFECAKKYDARMNIYFNNSPALVVAVAAKKLGAVNLVTGFPEEGSSGFIGRIHEILPELTITMVDKEMNRYNIIPSDKQKTAEAKLLSVH
jgi:two-component system sensor histidine kinase KdpD